MIAYPKSHPQQRSTSYMRHAWYLSYEYRGTTYLLAHNARESQYPALFNEDAQPQFRGLLPSIAAFWAWNKGSKFQSAKQGGIPSFSNYLLLPLRHLKRVGEGTFQERAGKLGESLSQFLIQKRRQVVYRVARLVYRYTHSPSENGNSECSEALLVCISMYCVSC